MPSASTVFRRGVRGEEGDTLRRILVDVYHASEDQLPDLYRRIRVLNPGIEDLDSIQVGTSIRIPVPGKEEAPGVQRREGIERASGVEEVSAEEYVVRQGEYLAKIIKELYGVPDELVFRKYIHLVKGLNPDIKDPNRILAGQRIRMPSVRQVLSETAGPCP
jgi:nucleoid-associated protein YgaU